MDLGMSFSPTNTDKPQGQNGDPSGGQTPIQDAIKLLSLRIPQFRSQGGVASLPLLQGSGSMGVLGGGMGNGAHPGGLQQILAQMFGSQGMGGNMGSMGSMGSAPNPNIVIGANGQSQTGPLLPETPSAPTPPSGPTTYPHGGEATVPVLNRPRF